MRQRGFTLMEAMAVVALVAIVSTMAIPMMRNLIVQSALTAATNDVIGAMAAARSHAVREAGQFTVRSRDGGWNNGWCVVRGTADLCEATTGNVMALYSPPSTAIYVKSGPAASPVFQRNGVITGIATGTSGNVLICEKNGTHSRQIVFNRSGATSINKDVSGC